MAKQDNIKFDGRVIENLSNDKFKVELENGHIIIAYPCGKMRQAYIKVLVGDKVRVEISPYDVEKGIIKYRYK